MGVDGKLERRVEGCGEWFWAGVLGGGWGGALSGLSRWCTADEWAEGGGAAPSSVSYDLLAAWVGNAIKDWC